MDIRDRVPRRREPADEVAGHVRELILSGAARPGEFLRVDPLAEAVGVGATPVRDALVSLAGQGFVEMVPRRGFLVAAISRDDVRDLFLVQGQLAGELAARAARAVTYEQLSRIEDIDDDFRHAVETGDRAAIADLGHRFHREINLVAGSRQLALLLGSVVKHLPKHFYGAVERRVTSPDDDHRALVGALRARDAARARSLAEKHVLDGADGVVAALEEQGLWDASEPASRSGSAPSAVVVDDAG